MLRKSLVLLGMLCLGLALSSAQAQLLVDFAQTSTNVEAGYQAYKADHEVAATFTTQSFNAFGSTITVKPTWAAGAVKEAMQMIARNRTTAETTWYTGTHLDLLYDWIGTDTRSAGDPLTLTIGGLPAGVYKWLSYHHDPSNQTGVFNVTVTDAASSITTVGIDISHSQDEAGRVVDFASITRFETTIVSNGTNPIVFVFDQTSGPLAADPINLKFFVMNGFEITFDDKAGAPDPANDETGVALNLSDRTRVPGNLSWLAPGNPGITQVLGYDLYLDPNATKVANRDSGCLIAKPGLASSVTQYNPADFNWSQTYHWSVVTKYKLGASDPNVYESATAWSFRAIGAGPVVNAGSNLVTAMALLPANLMGTITDATNDVASVEWEVIYYPGDAVKEVAQMIDRGTAVVSADPDLLQDWIGSDTRSVGNPLIMTLSGLPAGSYTWTSAHHDHNDQTGLFDVTVIDAAGSATTTGIDISNGVLAVPADYTRFTTPIVSNGSDVKLIFSQQANTPNSSSFFLMNGFTLTGPGGSLLIDFGNQTSPVKAGYQAYKATHEVLATFAPQSFSAFGQSVTISVAWGLRASGVVMNASVTKTNSDLYAPTASFTADTVGTYIVQLTATDAENNVTSDTMTINAAVTPCAAAQLLPAWTGFNLYDIDQDCDVDLDDFAMFVLQWLDNRSLTGQAAN